MSKNHLNVLSLAAVLLLGLTRVVCADIAPDPVTRAIGILPFVLIAAVVIVAVLLIVKFFKK
jgi:hypothetical protein